MTSYTPTSFKFTLELSILKDNSSKVNLEITKLYDKEQLENEWEFIEEVYNNKYPNIPIRTAIVLNFLLIQYINNNSINSILAFKNSILINLLYSIIIWILGMTIIGVLFNVFILYLKGFIFGFSLSAFILTYKYKGIILSVLYTLFGQLLNIIVIMVLTIYSIMFTSNLLKQIIKSKQNITIHRYFKNYLIIFLFTLLISLLSSLCEVFIFPTLVKIIIKLFI